jgi:hypothetical protein
MVERRTLNVYRVASVAVAVETQTTRTVETRIFVTRLGLRALAPRIILSRVVFLVNFSDLDSILSLPK